MLGLGQADVSQLRYSSVTVALLLIGGDLLTLQHHACTGHS